MNDVYFLGGSIAGLILVIVIIAIVAPKVKSLQRRKALEQILERQQHSQSRQALVRYVMLNRQCSEDIAYQRLATFVQRHAPLNDAINTDRMSERDMQSLLDAAQSILLHDPDAIDKI